MEMGGSALAVKKKITNATIHKKTKWEKSISDLNIDDVPTSSIYREILSHLYSF
jgi:hypothetical protein